MQQPDYKFIEIPQGKVVGSLFHADPRKPPRFAMVKFAYVYDGRQFYTTRDWTAEALKERRKWHSGGDPLPAEMQGTEEYLTKAVLRGEINSYPTPEEAAVAVHRFGNTKRQGNPTKKPVKKAKAKATSFTGPGARVEWVMFTKRTEDPKLAYLEHRLTELGIPHRRSGDSWHAPIMEVLQQDEDRASELLSEKYGRKKTLDDVRDDDPFFYGFKPHDFFGDADDGSEDEGSHDGDTWSSHDPDEWIDEDVDEGSLDYFNRYIAGDR